jgi:RiboL-PSP-HEPN
MAYASAVNALRLPCKDASTPLVALTLAKAFAALRDLNNKHPEFSKIVEDRDLHMIARERVFLENFEKMTAQQVEIPDQAVDTKSNLSSIVLKRNLFQLGLRYPIVAAHAGKIDRLLGIRNAIAHGDKLKVPKDADVKDYLRASFEVMRFVQDEVFSSLRDKMYQRDSAADLALLPDGIVQRAMAFVKSIGTRF